MQTDKKQGDQGRQTEAVDRVVLQSHVSNVPVPDSRPHGATHPRMKPAIQLGDGT